MALYARSPPEEIYESREAPVTTQRAGEVSPAVGVIGSPPWEFCKKLTIPLAAQRSWMN
jgi:hypothetical protein